MPWIREFRPRQLALRFDEAIWNPSALESTLAREAGRPLVLTLTENRSVLHVALRAPKGTSIVIDGADVVPQVHEVLDRWLPFRCAFAVASGRGTPASESGTS